MGQVKCIEGSEQVYGILPDTDMPQFVMTHNYIVFLWTKLLTCQTIMIWEYLMAVAGSANKLSGQNPGVFVRHREIAEVLGLGNNTVTKGINWLIACDFIEVYEPTIKAKQEGIANLYMPKAFPPATPTKDQIRYIKGDKADEFIKWFDRYVQKFRKSDEQKLNMKRRPNPVLSEFEDEPTIPPEQKLIPPEQKLIPNEQHLIPPEQHLIPNEESTQGEVNSYIGIYTNIGDRLNIKDKYNYSDVFSDEQNATHTEAVETPILTVEQQNKLLALRAIENKKDETNNGEKEQDEHPLFDFLEKVARRPGSYPMKVTDAQRKKLRTVMIKRYGDDTVTPCLAWDMSAIYRRFLEEKLSEWMGASDNGLPMKALISFIYKAKNFDEWKIRNKIIASPPASPDKPKDLVIEVDDGESLFDMYEREELKLQKLRSRLND